MKSLSTTSPALMSSLSSLMIHAHDSRVYAIVVSDPAKKLVAHEQELLVAIREWFKNP